MSREIDARKGKVAEYVVSSLPELSGLARFLHDNPETAFNERKASEKICALMEGKGFAVERGLGGLETAFKASKRHGTGSPVFAFIAEYDALPEIGHACGHNLIAAMSVGAAAAADRVLGESGLNGTVVLMGTPAEEQGGGKVVLVEAGCFDGIDCALMVHPAARTQVDDRTLASARLILKYAGKPAHASSAPWNGANALEAVIQTFNQINAWRCQLREFSRINGIITSGGKAVNIIPEYAEASFGIRAADREYLEELVEKVRLCANNAASSLGVSVDIVRTGRGYDSIVNNPVLRDLMAANFSLAGEEVVPRREDAGLASADMGNVTRRLPSAHCYVKVEAGIEMHTAEFAQACNGPEAGRALAAGAKAMGMTAVEVFSDPALLTKINAAFSRGKPPSGR